MKTRKKLLHSTLILALAFGQTSGTIVEAVSALNADGSSNTKKILEEEKETTSKTKSVTTEVVKDIKK
ncbi:hypothetical protein [Enterococcus hirae]|uniref:hypothetical protein n=1 Tax=Enterococcus hirae TaxID=1354 RepID=UPI002DBF4154|nr:hypothetical protein [Enterococcus hirae]MEB5733989.1 hypothetical protein [Enterococcus hirae]